MEVNQDIFYVGVNDHTTDLFEGQYAIPGGIAYNSYIIKEGKCAVLDTVDIHFTHQWLGNIREVLGTASPDYLIIQHMEPDHSASIDTFMQLYPQAKIVSSEKAFAMMKRFFGTEYEDRRIIVREGDTLSAGRHELTFIEAPMVHWPEVIVTYDRLTKTLFSADAFGKFGALDITEDWTNEARRYYIGIVGKYGKQVRLLLKKAAALDLEMICPLHGPVLKENLGYYLNLYDTWSSYKAEENGIVIAYTSIYGHTRKAVEELAELLRQKKCPKVTIYDLARCDLSQAVADAFRFGKLILATTTYNSELFPAMRQFIHSLTERGFRSRTVALIENGSWAPNAARIMKEMLAESPDIEFAGSVIIESALNSGSIAELEQLSDKLCREYIAHSNDIANKSDMSALFNIGYGLYVVTAAHDGRDNGCIVNAVTQITNTPNRIAVTIDKSNLTHDMVLKTGKLNVNCLSEKAPFEIFERFGFHSGRELDKFKDFPLLRADNGAAYLPEYINSFLSLKVENALDFDTHTMFVCEVTECRTMNSDETMTYTYYLEKVKPKPETDGKKGFVCKICGYVYEGDELPPDFICPLCKHGAVDFEPL